MYAEGADVWGTSDEANREAEGRAKQKAPTPIRDDEAFASVGRESDTFSSCATLKLQRAFRYLGVSTPAGYSLRRTGILYLGMSVPAGRDMLRLSGQSIITIN